MVVKHPVYGKQKINEDVLKEIAFSKELLRLKGITQFGVPDKYWFKKGFDRYEHSLGVLCLLRILGTSLETQVAGLIHDVSTLAFSHVADWVFGATLDEDYHEREHGNYIATIRIPSILKKYGFNIKKITNPFNFPVLDYPLPHLCADRVDYTLREFKIWAAPNIVDECLNDLLVFKKSLVFGNIKTAEKFARAYLELQKEHWGSRQAVVRYELLSRVLKSGLKKGLIKPRDFYQTDYFIIKKIEKDRELKEKLRLLKSQRLPKTSGKKRVRKKFRYVDPWVLVDGRIRMLSTLVPKFAKEIEKHRRINRKGILV